MTNYAAFYVGRGENAEWIGTARAPRRRPRPRLARPGGIVPVP